MFSVILSCSILSSLCAASGLSLACRPGWPIGSTTSYDETLMLNQKRNAATGAFYTNAPQDLFFTLNSQLEIAQKLTAEVLFRFFWFRFIFWLIWCWFFSMFVQPFLQCVGVFRDVFIHYQTVQTSWVDGKFSIFFSCFLLKFLRSLSFSILLFAILPYFLIASFSFLNQRIKTKPTMTINFALSSTIVIKPASMSFPWIFSASPFPFLSRFVFRETDTMRNTVLAHLSTASSEAQDQAENAFDEVATGFVRLATKCSDVLAEQILAVLSNTPDSKPLFQQRGIVPVPMFCSRLFCLVFGLATQFFISSNPIFWSPLFLFPSYSSWLPFSQVAVAVAPWSVEFWVLLLSIGWMNLRISSLELW